MRPELRAQVVLDGLFLFNPARHDYGDKQFLGHRIAGAGLAEVDQAVDLLARHPATAHFHQRQAGGLFPGDAPPPALVDRMARTFLASDGDIAAVLQTLYASPEFARSLDAGVFGRPGALCVFVAAAGLCRHADHRQSPACAEPAAPARPAAEPAPHARRLPAGASDWAGPGQMTARFETARAIAAAPPNFYRDPAENPQQQQQQQQQQQTPQPPSPRLPDLLKAYAGTGLFDRLSPDTRRRWRRPPIRATSIPTCWPRRNSCGASPRPHNTAPSAPEILMHRRRLLQPWPPPLRAGHRPPLRAPAARDNRLLVVFMRGAYDAASLLVPAASDFYYESRPTIAILALAAALTPRCRWPTAGRCIPRWPPA